MFDHSRKPPEGASARAPSPPAAGRAAPTTALVQRRAGGEASGRGGTVDEVVGALPAGSGAGLLDDQRGRFEASLGTDLSAVRVHTGPASAAAASELGARAFTTGNDIHFGAGEHRPDDPFGMHLLAHEVAHTVQQRGGAGGPQAKLAVSQPGDPLEREADLAADAMVHGGPAAVSVGAAASAATVQRRQGEGERAGERVDETRERGVESGNGELDRRTGGASAADDGSGEWGGEADDRGLTDHANRQMWFQVANAAEGMGLTNAARHMRHYLNNSGATLQVSVDSMLRDVESFRTAYDTELDEARAQADERIAAMGDVTTEQTFTLTGERRSTVYCTRAESDDWYFAVGGFTHWWTAEVTVTPAEGASAPAPAPAPSPAAPPAPSPGAPAPAPSSGSGSGSGSGSAPAPAPAAPTPAAPAPAAPGRPRVTMRFTMHMFDRYNWDQGKSVTIAGITVRDEQLGRLHRVGLAREFDVEGSSTPHESSWTFTGAGAGAAPEGQAPTGRDLAGGRADPTRERGLTPGRPSDGAPRGR